MLYKVGLSFESADEILKCDHSNESCWAVLSCGAVYYAVQGRPNFWVCGWNPNVWPVIQMKAVNKLYFLSLVQHNKQQDRELQVAGFIWMIQLNLTLSLLVVAKVNI